MTTAAKLAALRAALERDGEVKFKDGSIVRRETVVKIVVERPGGGISTYPENELGAAYAMALHGPVPRPQPEGDTAAMFGDAPPFP